MADLVIDNPAIAADNLCARIQADAEAQAQLILGEANAQAAQIVGVAEAEAQSLRNAVMIAAQAEAQAEEKRILAAVNLETRKIILTAREELVAQVIAQLQDRVSAWRATSGYRQYLKSLVIQAARAVSCSAMEVVTAAADQAVIDDNFRREVAQSLKDKYGQAAELTFIVDPVFTDAGVRVRSLDRRVVYDNTFGARLQRSYETIRTAILKEAFGADV